MRSELAEELSLDFDGVNVEFLTVESEDHLSIKVIERGVGWTRACGPVRARGRGRAPRRDVWHRRHRRQSGGALHVTLNGAAATLSGPVQFVRTWNGSKRDLYTTTLIDRTIARRSSSSECSSGRHPRRARLPARRLALLVDTPGATWSRESSSDVTRRSRDVPRSGKVQELREICLAVDSDTLSSSTTSHGPAAHLEKILGRTAIDRTAVIWTSSPERSHARGKAQVELHCCSTACASASGRGSFSNRRGIGTRGPGETQLETTGAAS